MIIWVTQCLLEKIYSTLYMEKKYVKKKISRLKNQKANQRKQNTFFLQVDL